MVGIDILEEHASHYSMKMSTTETASNSVIASGKEVLHGQHNNLLAFPDQVIHL